MLLRVHLHRWRQQGSCCCPERPAGSRPPEPTATAGGSRLPLRLLLPLALLVLLLLVLLLLPRSTSHHQRRLECPSRCMHCNVLPLHLLLLGGRIHLVLAGHMPPRCLCSGCGVVVAVGAGAGQPAAQAIVQALTTALGSAIGGLREGTIAVQMKKQEVEGCRGWCARGGDGKAGRRCALSDQTLLEAPTQKRRLIAVSAARCWVPAVPDAHHDCWREGSPRLSAGEPHRPPTARQQMPGA